MKIPENILKSAEISAAAYDKPIGIYLTVECNTHTGGKWFTAFDPQKATEFCFSRPYRWMASVLP